MKEMQTDLEQARERVGELEREKRLITRLTSVFPSYIG